MRGTIGGTLIAAQGRRAALLLLLWAVLGPGCSEEAVLPSGELFIETEPVGGATIIINGVEYGETPVALTGLPPGPIVVHLVKEDYRHKSVIVNMPSEGKRHQVVALEPLTGYITFESVPDGARVSINGEAVGITPLLEKPVPVGAATYELFLDDYEALRREVTVKTDYRYRYVHELKPKIGQLVVFSRPSGAKIWLNNDFQVKTTPATFELHPGVYTVALYLEGYITADTTVDLPPNARHTVDVKLQEGSVPFGMVLIPPGEFICGVDNAAPDERPRRKVHLPTFYIDKCEVTNAQFKTVFPSHTFQPVQAHFPVTGVSFKQAQAYAAAVGKRLPTELEWEKAARGVDGRDYPWGDDFDKARCNGKTVVGGGVKEIGQYPLGASPFGCLDMAGNAYELTSSWYEAYPGNKTITKEYGQIFRVLRGGSYLSGRFDLRCARRHYDKMDAVRNDYGFRCAKDVEQQPEAIQTE